MTSRTITIQTDDGGSFSGYLSLPPAGTGPGIVLIQEIFGVNSHIRAVADQYALDGFVVLAPDVFWRLEPGLDIGYSAEDMQRGVGLMQKLDFARAVQDLRCAATTLRSLPECSGTVASLGFCMGGMLSFLCAANAGVDAAVCYYPGGIDSRLDQAGNIKCPVMIHFAEKDRLISPAAVAATKQAFAGRSEVRIEVHPNVEHGFNCWARPAYERKAAAVAHAQSLAFLASVL